jgi:hypothetical protein
MFCRLVSSISSPAIGFPYLTIMAEYARGLSNNSDIKKSIGQMKITGKRAARLAASLLCVCLLASNRTRANARCALTPCAALGEGPARAERTGARPGELELDERHENKFPGFSPETRCMFLRRSAASCQSLVQRRCEKPAIKGVLLVGAVGIEPTTSPV